MSSCSSIHDKAVWTRLSTHYTNESLQPTPLKKNLG